MLLSLQDALERGHSSPEMAGTVAKRVNAKLLVLNHFAANAGPEELRDLVLRAEQSNGGVSHVVSSFDFMELIVPRFGFGDDADQQDNESHHANDDSRASS